MKLFEVIFISIFLLFLEEAISQFSRMKIADRYYAKTLSIDCFVNPKFITNMSCKLKPINWEQSLAYLDGDLFDVVYNATIRLEGYKYTNQFRPFLLNVTVNLCEMLEKQQGNRYMLTVLKVLSNYSNSSHKCPYSGHLHAAGIFLDHNFVPFVIPSAKYKMVFTFYKDWLLLHLGTIAIAVIILEKK